MGCGVGSIPKYALKFNLIKNTKNVRCIFQLSRGNVVTCGGDGKFYIWEKLFRNTVDVFQAHRKCITAVVLMKDNLLISCGLDLKMNQWEIDATSHKFINKEVFGLDNDPYTVLRLSSSQFALGCESGIKIYKINPFIQNYSIGLSTPCLSIIELKDGRIASNSLYQIVIWNYWKPEVKPEYLQGHEKSVRSLLLLRDGNMATGAEDKKIIIWNIKGKYCVQELEGHKGPVISLLLLSTGNMISGDQYSLILIWSLDLSCIEQTLIQEGSILSLYQLKNSASIGSVSSANEVKIWGSEN